LVSAQKNLLHDNVGIGFIKVFFEVSFYVVLLFIYRKLASLISFNFFLG